MRIALLILGGLLLLQTIGHLVIAALDRPYSAEAIAAQIDADLVRLTAALCALYLGRYRTPTARLTEP